MDAHRQAAAIGNVDYFKVAEDKDVLQARDTNFDSVLTYAAAGGHLECCKVILGRWPDLLYAPNINGDTALSYAIYLGKIEIVKFLAAGAKQRLFRMGHITHPSPLHFAVAHAALEMVKILTEADPDFDSIPANKDGETPQMLAVRLASTKTDRNDIRVQIKDWIIKKLEEKKAAPKGLEPDPIDRATKGDADLFRGAQGKECIQSRDKNGNSVLSVAGHFECSKEILTKADPDHNQLPANNNGETPLMIAQRLASGKMNDNVEVKIRDLLLGKELGTENTEEETTSDGNKLVPTARERELSIPLKYLDLYRRIVRQFGGIVPLTMDKLEVGPVGNALASFLAIVAEMQVETPETISEEKLDKWGYVYFDYAGLGLKIDWFSDRVLWFRDWLDRRAKALYPVEDEVDRIEKKLSAVQAELNLSKARLENTRSAYSKFDFKVVRTDHSLQYL